MAVNKLALFASGLAVAGLVAGGTTLAFADTTATTASAAPAASAPAAQQGRGAEASRDTVVSGDEATKVTDAVRAKDATVTIETVRKDPDGSYDALGTKADGTRVFYEVSADLATITENAGGPGGGRDGHGGPGGASQDTVVTGDEATKVTDAVRAKDATVTIETVRKDPDGSYDALGTKADGTKVFYEVSADLASVTENAGGPGHGTRS